MWEKYKKLKEWVIARVLWAETELKGKTGAEKRAAVVEKLDEAIRLPFWLEWADGPLIGWLVDLVCAKLNLLTDGDFSGVVLDEKQTEELAAVLDAKATAVSAGATLDERLAELCREYGVETETPTKSGDLTENFSRAEFACKCGCGAADTDPRLAALCQTIRDAVGVPVRVNSGVRCAAHNQKVGGVPGSYHVQGLAADLSCSLGANKLYEVIQALYMAGKLSGLEYCRRYPTFVHVDIGKPRKERFSYGGGK